MLAKWNDWANNDRLLEMWEEYIRYCSTVNDSDERWNMPQTVTVKCKMMHSMDSELSAWARPNCISVFLSSLYLVLQFLSYLHKPAIELHLVDFTTCRECIQQKSWCLSELSIPSLKHPAPIQRRFFFSSLSFSFSTELESVDINAPPSNTNSFQFLESIMIFPRRFHTLRFRVQHNSSLCSCTYFLCVCFVLSSIVALPVVYMWLTP